MCIYFLILNKFTFNIHIELFSVLLGTVKLGIV